MEIEIMKEIKYTTKDSKVIKCIMCNQQMTEIMSHNAEPVRKGRCCSLCNEKIVIPTRLTLLFARRGGEK